MTDGTTRTFTPCFDWVVKATGSSSAALAYGIVWRYAQMQQARCFASCERLSAELAWSRQRIMRHLKRLVDKGLIVCLNPDAAGVTREYVPTDRDEWAGAEAEAAETDEDVEHDAAPVAARYQSGHRPAPGDGMVGDEGCSTVIQSPETIRNMGRATALRPPVAPCDTKSTNENTRDETTEIPGSVALAYQRSGSLAFEYEGLAQLHAGSSSDLIRDRDSERSAEPPGIDGQRSEELHADPYPVAADAGAVQEKRERATPSATIDSRGVSHRETPKRCTQRSRADARTRAPAIQLIKRITGSYPPKPIYERVIAAVGVKSNEARLNECYEIWCSRGYNPRNYAWLLDWYVSGEIPSGVGRAGASRRSSKRMTAVDTNAMADEFARWGEYQEALQRGEDGDEAKRRLGL